MFLPAALLAVFWKNCPEFAVIVVFIPYLIETYLLPTMGLVCVMLVPLPRLRDLRLTGMLAAAGTKTSFIDEGICRGMFFQGYMGLFERL